MPADFSQAKLLIMTTPELQPLVDAEISIEGLRTPIDEERLRRAIAKLPGVEEPTLYGGMLALRYDPTSTTKVKICNALVQAGFDASMLRGAPASPVVDALKD